MLHEDEDDTTYNWGTRNTPQRINKGIGRLGNMRIRGDHPD